MFTVGHALSQGFRIWARNFIPFQLLGLIIYLPLILWVALGFNEGIDEKTADTIAAAVVVGPILFNILLSGVVTYGVVMEMRGTHVGLGACVSMGIRRFLPALGVSIMSLIAVIVGFVCLFVPGVILYCMLYVAVQASVMERPGLFGALHRSRVLTEGNKSTIFALLFLVGIITGIPRYVVEKIILPNPEAPPSFAAVKTHVYATLGFSIVIGTLGAVIAAVTYFQLRQDKDGVSIEEIARVFE
jgi:hypothetical protein